MTVRMPGAVLDTLQAIIAPGRRARLSPFVESAQIQVLLDELVDDRRHFESVREALQRHRERITRIAGRWDAFVDVERRSFARNDYAERDFLDAYLAYYLSVNVPKVQQVLLDLVRAGELQGEIRLLDVGVGTGTTAIALLDFLVAWGQVADLYGQDFPVTQVRLLGIDRSDGSLAHARQMVEAYAAALGRRMAARGSDSLAALPYQPQPTPDTLERAHAWASAAVWQRHDLEHGPPTLPFEPNLVVLGNVINELGDAGLDHAGHLLRQLPDGARVIVIEPGSEKDAQWLMRWRRGLVRDSRTYVSLGPCGQEYGDMLPASCDRCWNSRREAFHQTLLYRAFREGSVQLSRNPRRFDEYENTLLSWSYVILGKQPASETRVERVGVAALEGQTVRASFEGRCIGSYRRPTGGGLAEPVNSAPDEFRADGRANGAWSEYLRICPGPYGVEVIGFEHPPGFEVPPLRYGQRFRVRNVLVIAGERGRYQLKPREGEESAIEPLDDAPGDGSRPSTSEGLSRGFLPAYDARTKRAVDELAYRLFGFSAMRDFQHRILERVLMGKHILGIAATGSGKSECFILPAMILPGVTVVISPLKSLMADQFEQRISRRYGLERLATCINGDVPFRERQARLKRIELLIAA